ncbi:MAG: hypothetical protein PHQ04_06445 [Opitutaceae bacterium]|nr:hypothetical protein [Opitutaceae bacterium]
MSAPVPPPPAPRSDQALYVGLAGIATTGFGLMFSPLKMVAFAWLVGVMFWTAITIGMLLLVLIHHIFDASWSTIIRRQYEHWLSAFKWLALLFLPLLVLSWMPRHSGLVWSWMDPATPLPGGHGTVGTDVLYVKKSAFLNLNLFTIATIAFFAVWVFLSCKLRKHSFAQDADGDAVWTLKNRWWAAAGIPLAALSLTFASILWVKSLEYHWFSTMYGVWFFSNCVRGALSMGVLMMLWLYHRGDYAGLLNRNHLHSIGQLVFAFTVFWGYVSFSQYFLIWNANIPEETFWYNLREQGDWYWVGMLILFGHFFVPFLYLLSYKHKVVHAWIRPIVIWVLALIFVDICYNILPAIKDARGDPLPFLSLTLLWSLTAVIGVGGICVWAYLRSFPTTKLIPIRDPRIAECLVYHESSHE